MVFHPGTRYTIADQTGVPDCQGGPNETDNSVEAGSTIGTDIEIEPGELLGNPNGDPLLPLVLEKASVDSTVRGLSVELVEYRPALSIWGGGLRHGKQQYAGNQA